MKSKKLMVAVRMNNNVVISIHHIMDAVSLGFFIFAAYPAAQL